MTASSDRRLGQDVLQLAAERLSNWARWGDTDALGTANFIVDEVRTKAARCVQTGESISLALKIDGSGPVGPGRPVPIHAMTATGGDRLQQPDLGGGAGFTDDLIIMGLQSSTQWDGLAHIHYGGLTYNGVPAASVDAAGDTHHGFEKAADRFISRGILLDFPLLYGQPVERQAIGSADLDAMCANQGLQPESGDIVLIRTGSMSIYDQTKSWRDFRAKQSGLTFETLDWFHEHEIAALACDNATVELPGMWDDFFVPFHMIAIRDMGLWLGEYWHLEQLAAASAKHQRWTFLLSAQGLPIASAVGSPVHPIATL